MSNGQLSETNATGVKTPALRMAQEGEMNWIAKAEKTRRWMTNKGPKHAKGTAILDTRGGRRRHFIALAQQTI